MDDIKRIETSARYSRVVMHNGIAYVGGQTAGDLGKDIRGQTEDVLAKIDKYLALAGTDRSRILSAQIWLKDIARDFASMNAVWDAWTDPSASPARATAQCEMASPDILVEIIVVAAV